jgi:hypothetical protein
MKRKMVHIEERPYEVGYGKPPRHTQFKKGRSGNPRGRRPRRPYEELEFPLRTMMMEPVVVSLNGRKRRVPRYEVVMLSIVNNAMAGDYRCQKLLVDICGGFTGFRREWRQEKSKADEAYINKVIKEAEEWFGKDEMERKP